MPGHLDESVKRARYLLNNIQNAAMATVNEDGSPHNTPYMFMRSDDLSELYWGTHPEALHSQNIARTGRLFVVLYEADQGGGLYINAEKGRIAEGEELIRALETHNRIRRASGRVDLPLEYYQPPHEQRMYIAETKQFFVNYNVKDEDGHIRKDVREEIPKEALV